MDKAQITNDILSFSFIIQSTIAKLSSKLNSTFNEYIKQFNQFESLLPQSIDSNLYEAFTDKIQIKGIDLLMRNLNQSILTQLEECSIDKEIESLFEIIEQMKQLSTQLVYRHLHYDNSDYYGEVFDTNIKEGLGALISPSLIALGLFKENSFKSGIIINQAKHTISKGEIGSDNCFTGLAIDYSKEKPYSIDSCSFGLWKCSKPINQTTIEFQRKEGIITIRSNDYSIKYNKTNQNDLMIICSNGSIIYNKGKSLVVDKQVLWMHFSSGMYSGTYQDTITQFNEGVFLYKNGDYYKGHYESNKKQGQGLYFDKERGLVIEGDFNKDTLIKGTIKKGSQLVYEGSFNPDGDISNGKYYYDNGDTYEGQFKYGKREGLGKYISLLDFNTKEEITIDCDWSKDKKNGVLKDYKGFSIVFEEGVIDRVYYN